MRKRKYVITAFALIVALSCSVGSVAANAAQDSATYSLTGLIQTVADNYGGAAVTDRFDLDLLAGDFGAPSNAVPMDKVTSDKNGMTLTSSDRFSAYVYNRDTETAKFATANDKSGTGHNAVFIRLTAKKDIAVDLKHPTFAVEKDSWITQNVAYKMYYRDNASAAVKEISFVELKAVQADNDGSVTVNHHGDTVSAQTYNAIIPADALMRSANLKAGSQLYIAYAYVGSDSGGRNMGLKLSIVTSENDYVDEIPVMSRESKYSYASMVSTTIANALSEGKTLIVPEGDGFPAGYEGSANNKTQTDLNIWQLMYGKLDGEIHPFNYFANVGAGAANDAVLYPSGSNATTYLAGFQRWQMRCSNGIDAIISITATSDSLLKITHAGFATSWAMHSGIRIIAENDEGVRVNVKNTMLLSTTEGIDNYYTGDVHMKAGDTVYVVYYTQTVSSGTCTFAPAFEAVADEYSEEARPDFESAKKVLAARPAAIRELSAYMLELTELRYSLESWMEVENLLDDFEASVVNYDTMEQLSAGLAEYKSLMDSVDTLVDEQDSLWSYKRDKIDELLAYVNALSSKSYGSDNWQKVTKAYEEGADAIKKANSRVAVNNVLASAKKAVDSVEKDKGCGGFAQGTSMFAVLAVMGSAALILLIKRKGGKIHE